MSTAQVNAWIQVATTLIEVGYKAEGLIKTLIAAVHPGMSEDELAVICDDVLADATVRQAMADRDSGAA